MNDFSKEYATRLEPQQRHIELHPGNLPLGDVETGVRRARTKCGVATSGVSVFDEERTKRCGASNRTKSYSASAALSAASRVTIWSTSAPQSRSGASPSARARKCGCKRIGCWDGNANKVGTK